MSPSQAFTPQFPHASGEMAARVRAFDWAATPLGPIDAWPQSLRIAVDICMHSRFPMFVWWGAQLINIYNDAYVPMLARRHPEALGRPAHLTWSDIWSVVGPQGEAVMQRAEATWNERVLLVMERKGYSEETWFTWSYSPIIDESGAVGGLFCACYEETSSVLAERERDKALAAEQRARAEAESASRTKDEFLATLSHELRTPLNAILGWSSIIRRPGVTPQELMRGADVIERNARAQATIIEDLLDMSAIISGKVRLEMERLDIAAVVRAAMDTAAPGLQAKEIAVRVEIEPMEGIELRGDPNRLQQVLWNLLSNATKFTPREGRVAVRAVRAGEEVQISVADNGEGIEARFLPFVFDRFRQADASTTRRFGGLGLGLAIVKQLVEMHGGNVRVASGGPGHGATFVVALPVHAPGGEAASPSSAAPAAIHTDWNVVNGMRVLVVDDDNDARDLVRRLLEDCGAFVDTARSAREAMAALRAARYDVLVSDIGMPEEDGHSLIRQVRELAPQAGGDTAAVALTAYARPEDRDKAIRAGFQMHATKPVDAAELLAIISVLGRRAAKAREASPG